MKFTREILTTYEFDTKSLESIWKEYYPNRNIEEMPQEEDEWMEWIYDKDCTFEFMDSVCSMKDVEVL